MIYGSSAHHKRMRLSFFTLEAKVKLQLGQNLETGDVDKWQKTGGKS